MRRRLLPDAVLPRRHRKREQGTSGRWKPSPNGGMPGRPCGRCERSLASSRTVEHLKAELRARLVHDAQRYNSANDSVPLAMLVDAELDVQRTARAGARGLLRLVREALEEERTRRQGAQG